MKKEILTIAFLGLLATTASTTLNANCINDYVKGKTDYAEYEKCNESAKRNAMSYEEGQVYDLEQKNELNRRQKAAEREAYEQKSFTEKAKSWFN